MDCKYHIVEMRDVPGKRIPFDFCQLKKFSREKQEQFAEKVHKMSFTGTGCKFATTENWKDCPYFIEM